MMNMKYLSDGRAIEVIQKLDSGFLVAEIYEADGECYTDKSQIEIVEKVYDVAPTEKYEEKIALLNKTIDNLREAKNAITRELNELQRLEKSEKMRFAKYRRYSQLQFLDDYLDGKITHFVVDGFYGTAIATLEEMKTDDRYDKGFKLLTLYGRSDGNLQWKINEYSDGSGSHKDVFPCVSYEQALSIAKDVIGKKFIETAERPSEYLIKSANTLGIQIPESYQSTFNSKLIKQETEHIQECEKEIKKRQDTINKINEFHGQRKESL